MVVEVVPDLDTLSWAPLGIVHSFSCFMVPRATRHGGLLRTYRTTGVCPALFCHCHENTITPPPLTSSWRKGRYRVLWVVPDPESGSRRPRLPGVFILRGAGGNQHDGFLRKCRLERLPLPVSFPRKRESRNPVTAARFGIFHPSWCWWQPA